MKGNTKYASYISDATTIDNHINDQRFYLMSTTFVTEYINKDKGAEGVGFHYTTSSEAKVH